ncbi:MAG: hypothetical protein AB8H86_19240 [Polyangiales bacterium]
MSTRLLDLLTEGPLESTGIRVGTAHFALKASAHALFDVYVARWCDEPLQPIDGGIAGPLIHSEHVANIGEGGEVEVSAPSAFWNRALALPFHGAVSVSYRAYDQERVNGPSAVLRTHELVFAPAKVGAHPTSQPTLHSGHLFSCGPLGFALVAGDELADFARHVPGGNVLDRFTTTEEAEAFLERGDLLPVLGIHPWTYRLVLSRGALSKDERALLGSNVLQRRYRVARRSQRHVELIDGVSLEDFHQPRVLASLPWPLPDGDVDLSGFTTGPHGDGLVPTYLIEAGTVDRPRSDACINEDLGELYERVAHSKTLGGDGIPTP